MNKSTLFLKSMEELSAIARDTSVPKMLRREALQVLHSREQWLYERHLRSGKVSKVYVPDLQ
jgi:uncharacterized protein (UPF0147 family)